jgi:methylated-DNA-[protein]-cysteine S-methyltransferase
MRTLTSEFRQQWNQGRRTMRHMHYLCSSMKSPVGKLTLVGSARGLAAVLWEHGDSVHERLAAAAADPGHPLLVQAQRELEEYFAGSRQRFTVRLDLCGTEFQNKVWNALRTIPFGETRSYGEIAKQIGSSKAVRAVGAANGRNPVPIIVPCHRVIGADGTLTGFGGGLENKARLLALEGWSVSAQDAQLALGV